MPETEGILVTARMPAKGGMPAIAGTSAIAGKPADYPMISFGLLILVPSWAAAPYAACPY
jgi:hypothetical protein